MQVTMIEPIYSDKEERGRAFESTHKAYRRRSGEIFANEINKRTYARTNGSVTVINRAEWRFNR
ncbi:hypothetical protein MRY16398_45920 [Phytobacter sp. MRY16-398]|nr:hypothetical protein MRY16398_45920 [Phytobacter sp. MRY16-398]